MRRRALHCGAHPHPPDWRQRLEHRRFRASEIKIETNKGCTTREDDHAPQQSSLQLLAGAVLANRVP